MTNEQRQNLLNAARAAEDAEAFDQQRIGFCGSPGCVLGSYAERSDLQSTFRRSTNKDDDGYSDDTLRLRSTGESVEHVGPAVREHFGLDYDEARELFGSTGCDGADEDGDQAARYIRAFVARKDREAGR